MNTTTTKRIRQTVLSLSLLAALVAPIAAQAESDNHVRPPIRYGNSDTDYNTGNPMPTMAQELATRGTVSPVYDIATGNIIYSVPVVMQQVNVAPTQPVVATPVPIYAPPAYGQPGHAQPGYGHPGYGQPNYGQPSYGPAGYQPIVLNQRQIEMSLERQGYQRIQSVDYDRGYYTARARDQRNRSVKLTVSAETGRVLEVR